MLRWAFLLSQKTHIEPANLMIYCLQESLQVEMTMDEVSSSQLWHRVRVLGNILGQTMTAQYGTEFLEKEEEIRLLAKSRRQDESGDHQKLREVLSTLDEDDLISIARAFNQFLNLLNIAEQAETGSA